MAESGSEATLRLEALLPPEMARQAEEIGVRKASMDGPGQFALAVLAGPFIALGGVFATTALAGTGAAPWGTTRVLAGVAFSLGLILAIVFPISAFVAAGFEHSVANMYFVAPFNALKALGLIVVTSALGYCLGYILAWLWNRSGVARKRLA